MRVLVIAKTFLPRIGGRELYQDRVLSHFAPDEVIIMTPDREGDYAAFDANYRFKVVRGSSMLHDWFLRGRRGKARWLLELGGLCLREHIDVVLCETVLPDGLSSWLLRQTLGKPYIVWTHGNDLAVAVMNEHKRAHLLRVTDSAAKVVGTSTFLGQSLIELGVPSDKVAVVAPGVDPPFLAPDDGRAERVRERYGLQGKRVILTLAHLVALKGQDKVIEAMPAILDAVPDVVYLVVGDGPDRARLKALAKTLGVEQHVIFVGAVPYDEAPSFYSAADVFVMPNRGISKRLEGFGIVFLEASARGLPVVGGRSGGAQHAVADGESGYLVNPLDEAEVAWRVIELLCDPGLARRLGESGRRRVETQFTWDRAASEVYSLAWDVASASSSLAIHRRIWPVLSTLVQPNHKQLSAMT